MTASRWALYDELLEQVPRTALVKNFTYGPHWLVMESDQGGIGLAQHLPPRPGSGSPPGPQYDCIGRPLKAVAEYVKSWAFNEASIGLAALNAANNTTALVSESALGQAAVHNQGDAFDFFMPQAVGKKVTVIGHFPYLNRLRDRCDLSILERNPQPGDLPDPAAEYILPEQDFVYITGTAFINKTITRLLELAGRAVVCLVGPSTPMNPLLFKYGIKSLSGLVVKDFQPAAEAVKEDCCGAIFAKGGVKVNLVKG